MTAKTQTAAKAFGSRQGEKYIRLAYELEHDASRARAAGQSGYADALASAASSMGSLGRRIMDAAR